jgi:hypothetical protein
MLKNPNVQYDYVLKKKKIISFASEFEQKHISIVCRRPLNISVIY